MSLFTILQVGSVVNNIFENYPRGDAENIFINNW